MAAKTRTSLLAGLALAISLALCAGGAWAAVQNLGDGAKQNAAGGWDLPTQGSCPADPNQATRPDCLALRFPAFTTQGTCTADPTRSWSTGVCNDTVNTNQTDCEAQPDRKWINGICAIVMKDDDRNKAVCTIQHPGTWVTTGACVGAWIMPDATAYTPRLFTGTTNPGPGDQCLRCHNSVTQYNGPRVRDVDWYLRHGHKNMSRPVAPGSGLPWGGPGYECSDPSFLNRADCELHGGTWDRSIVIYPSDDSGNVFDWLNGQINMGGTPRDLVWIYGDWLSALPRAIAKLPASSSQVCSDPRFTTANCVANGSFLVNNAGTSYSCARCHTTGWTSDATINTAKLPETAFPGITWDRLSNAGPNVVNLSGGVTGDANKYASWDTWGITCTRCHESAIDNTGGTCAGSSLPSGLTTAALCTAAGGTWTAGPPFQAPLGRSSHHNVMTSSDGSNGGYCSDFTSTGNKLQCEFLGANTWYAQCSDPIWPTAGQCMSSAGCVNPGTGHGLSYTTQAACEAGTAGECSNPFYFTQTLCTTAGGSWTPAAAGWWTAKTPGLWSGSFCSIPGGTCSAPQYTTSAACTGAGGTWGGTPAACTFPAYTDYASCKAGSGTWASTWNDQIQCEDAGGQWTGFKQRRGQMITALCMDCHRQETGGLPYDANNPAGALKVGPAHGTVAFVSHPHGNQFLNSTHGKFGGTFSQIGSGTFNFGMTGEYKSFFMADGEAANTGNGCTGCHNVHKSVVEEAFEPAPGQEGAFMEECTACHNKDLNLVMHPKGTGTPLEEMATEPFEACVSCHMPDATHLWRINVDPNYSTFPASALTNTVNANTSPSGTYANAVWVDLDHACGQCHGGGSGQAFTTGSITSGSKVLTVADTTGFTVGQRISVAGGGALQYDDMGLGRGDFESYIVSVAPPFTINLAGAASLTVSGVDVAQNPVKNGAGYYTKAGLAGLAKGMHNDKPMVTFGYTLGSPNTLIANVDASASKCSGDIANCDAFEWDWGDSSPAGSGATATHTYAAAGTYAIKLTVEQFSVGSASLTRNVTVYMPDFPPTAAGVCSFDPNTWTETVTDSSTDDHGVKQVTVTWGDGSILASDTTSPFGPFTHTYANVGTFTLTQKAIDTIGQQSTRTCTVTPTYFTISGTVQDSLAAPVPSAVVTVKKGTQVVRTVYSASNGTFSAGSLKPGTYSVYITKTGFTFTSPAATVTVGPDSSGNTITGAATAAGGGKRRPPIVQRTGS